MKKDTRQLSPEIQQYNRHLVIKMHQEGISRKIISTTLGISYNTICIWIRTWQKGGDGALIQGKRGCREREARLLTPPQEAKLQQILLELNGHHKWDCLMHFGRATRFRRLFGKCGA
ncbi:helix-turn-helix domain-containing protein [Xenorhabdus koppenhoeferi]|uniref:helix-turn-helix domain-containing protein n=1 Tax=Xenorhabdus koppenhoeferi TaxID=351659 RepID=UPI000A82BE35|nr:helix-turn-helix domain-containing protein [Xenorhabdus koppenhoeferi]